MNIFKELIDQIKQLSEFRKKKNFFINLLKFLNNKKLLIEKALNYLSKLNEKDSFKNELLFILFSNEFLKKKKLFKNYFKKV